MTEKPLRVALIGTGFMGKCHALAWNAVAPVFGDVPRPELALLCDVNADLAGRRAAEFGFTRSSDDWRDCRFRVRHRCCLHHHAQPVPPGDGDRRA